MCMIITDSMEPMVALQHKHTKNWAFSNDISLHSQKLQKINVMTLNK